MANPIPFLTTEGHRDSRRGIAATKGIKATTDYTDFTDWEKEDKEENEFELKNSWTDQSVGFTQDASETNLKMFE